MASNISFKTAGQSTTKDSYKYCRRMLVGPWCNQPEEYEGYNGFVGWAGLSRLRSGRLLLTFTSGSWHMTPPWTEQIAKIPSCRQYLDRYRKIEQTRGCPDIRAPRGGRAHIMSSDDEGQTWSAPQTLINTECDDRAPTILELDDGTQLCTFFTYWLSQTSAGGLYNAKYMLSHDGGQCWSEPADPTRSGPVFGSFSNGPAIQLVDGTLVWVITQRADESDHPDVIGVYGSSDRGETFERLAVVKSDHVLDEPSVAQLPDGRLVLLTRRQGDICWSGDGGQTWTQPVSIGVDLFDPHLLVAPNGVLACFHGSYKTGGLRVVLSLDAGKTWQGPEEDLGYTVDTSVYGYSHQILLPDGSIYCVYQSTGGHRAADARTMALWGLRLRIRDKADGIDILPAPGSPAAKGGDPGSLENTQTNGGDPELGNTV